MLDTQAISAILTGMFAIFTTALAISHKSNRQYVDARIQDLNDKITSDLTEIKGQLQEIRANLNRVIPTPELLRQLQDLSRNGTRDRQQLNNRLSKVEAMVEEINKRLARIESILIRKGLSSRGDNHD